MRNGITFTSHGPVLECKHSPPVDVYLRLAMFRLLKIILLTVTVTFKQQPNFNSINICFFDWRTFKLI